MTGILAIDPGTDRSAWLELRGGRPAAFGIEDNPALVAMLRAWASGPVRPEAVVIERVESYGMPVGREVFDTVLWSGRFWEAVQPVEVTWIPRRAVKLAICHSPKANDASIRQALVDAYGGQAAGIGTKAAPGPLHGISKDVWSALALARTHQLQLEEGAA